MPQNSSWITLSWDELRQAILCFWLFFSQLLQLLRKILQTFYSVKLQKSFVHIPSTWACVDDDWVFTFGKLFPSYALKTLVLTSALFSHRDALTKMKDVYVKNPQMGDPTSVDPRLSEIGQNIEKLQFEVQKFEVSCGASLSSHVCDNVSVGEAVWFI